MRHYDDEKPNFCTAFELPEDLNQKLILLMKRLNLMTGSIDMIKSTNGLYYFLEVNPIGQYGEISESLNYGLDEEIANFLIEKSNS